MDAALQCILSNYNHLDLAGDIIEKHEHASGLGASCDVYKAWSKKRNLKVAVKQFRVYLTKDTSFARVGIFALRLRFVTFDDNLLSLVEIRKRDSHLGKPEAS